MTDQRTEAAVLGTRALEGTIGGWRRPASLACLAALAAATVVGAWPGAHAEGSPHPTLTLPQDTRVDGGAGPQHRALVAVDLDRLATGMHDTRLSAEDLEALASLRAEGLDPRLEDGTPLGLERPGAGAHEVLPFSDHPGVREVTWVAPGLLAVASDRPLDDLRAVPGVLDVSDDATLLLGARDPLPEQWGLANAGQPVKGVAGAAGADIRWSAAVATATGAGAVVAVIDSGIDLSHPDLSGSIWRNDDEVCDNGLDDDGNGYVDDCHGWDFVNGDPVVDDAVTATGAPADRAHGSHVAGVVAARGGGSGLVGVAPGALVMPLKVQEAGGFPSSRAAAIRYAVDNGAHVINASWGTPPGTPPSPAIIEAVAHAEAHGVLVVAAAGNAGADVDAAPAYPASLPNPNVVSVAATTHLDGLADFSNRGAGSVDLGAPGRDVLSTVPGGLAWMSGTSMAAPHVAGAAALLVEALGTADAATIRRELLAATRPVAALRSTTAAGGVLDVTTAAGLPTEGQLAIEVTGAAGLRDDTDVHLSVRTTAPGATPRHLQPRVTLGMVDGTVVVGVVEHPLTLDDHGTVRDTTTDEDALVPVSPLGDDRWSALTGAGLTWGLGLALPAGTYVLMVELVEPDTLATHGSPQVVTFAVAATAGDPPPPVERGGPVQVPSPPSGPVQPQPEPPATAPTDGTARGGRVLLCHGPTLPARHTLLVAPAAVPAHLAHGDTLGPCPGEDERDAVVEPVRPGRTPAPTPAPAPSPAPTAGPTTGPTAGPAPGSVPVPSPTRGTGSGPAPGPQPSAPPTSAPSAPPIAAPPPEPSTAPSPGPTQAPPSASPPQGRLPSGDADLWPRSGPASGGTMVKVSFTGGSDDLTVLFDGRALPILVRSSGYVLVRTAPHDPGPVPVEVRRREGGFRVPGEFTFLADTSSVPGPRPTTGPTTAPSTDPPTGPTSGPTAGPTTAPSSGPTSPPTSPPTSGPRRLQRGTIGSPTRHPSGRLVTDVFERDEPLHRLSLARAALQLCTTASCPGRSV